MKNSHFCNSSLLRPRRNRYNIIQHCWILHCLIMLQSVNGLTKQGLFTPVSKRKVETTSFNIILQGGQTGLTWWTISIEWKCWTCFFFVRDLTIKLKGKGTQHKTVKWAIEVLSYKANIVSFCHFLFFFSKIICLFVRFLICGILIRTSNGYFLSLFPRSLTSAPKASSQNSFR